MLSHSFPIDIPLTPSTHVIYKFIHKGSHAGFPSSELAQLSSVTFLFKKMLLIHTPHCLYLHDQLLKMKISIKFLLCHIFWNPGTHTIFQELPVPLILFRVAPKVLWVDQNIYLHFP